MCSLCISCLACILPSQNLVSVVLVFSCGATHACHTILINQDNICESSPNEFFFSDLAYVSGILPITISPPTAQVIIADSDQPECGEYSMSLLVGQRSCKKLRIAHE